jgi:hypothetical protein
MNLCLDGFLDGLGCKAGFPSNNTIKTGYKQYRTLVRNADVGGSTPLRSTGKALLTNTAGKAFSLGLLGFALEVVLDTDSSHSADERAVNDTDCSQCPTLRVNAGSNEMTDCFLSGVESTSLVPVACID